MRKENSLVNHNIGSEYESYGLSNQNSVFRTPNYNLFDSTFDCVDCDEDFLLNKRD